MFQIMKKLRGLVRKTWAKVLAIVSRYKPRIVVVFVVLLCIVPFITHLPEGIRYFIYIPLIVLFFLLIIGYARLRLLVLQIVAIACILLLIFTLVYLIIQFLLYLTQVVGLSKDLTATLFTVLVAAFSLIIGNIYKRQLDIAQKRLGKIIPVYEDFINFLVLLRNGTCAKQEIISIVIQLDKGIYKWGDYRVRNCWNQVRDDLLVKKLSDPNLQDKLVQLVIAIRRQVGHPEERESQTKDFLNWIAKY